MNITALNINKSQSLIDCWTLTLARRSDMNFIWKADRLICFQNMDEIFLSCLDDGRLILYERPGYDYTYPFYNNDLQEKTLGDLRRERLKELEGNVAPINPLVAQIYYLLKT